MKILFLLIPAVFAVMGEQLSELKELSDGNQEFTAKTYTELAEKNLGKNFLVCPLSVAVVMALAETGAAGDTAQQIIKGLSLPDTEENIHKAFKLIAPSLNVDNQYTLSSANKIYVKQGYKIKSQLKAVAAEVFQADVSEINFEQSEAAAAEINKWVSEKTRDKIKELLAKDDLDGSTRAVLVNALYFNGFWVHAFNVESTSKKPFAVSNTKETTVEMMEQTNFFEYYEDASLKAKFLKMNYLDSPISMIFVLPDDVDGLAGLESNLGKVLQTPKFTFERVHVQIPRIHVEQTIDFIPILKKFGVHDAFGTRADFSRLIENAIVYISKIVQKAFIDVEEKGTTAAAATAVIFSRQSTISGGKKLIREFNANHPFMFIVKHPNGIVFIGRYVIPDSH